MKSENKVVEVQARMLEKQEVMVKNLKHIGKVQRRQAHLLKDIYYILDQNIPDFQNITSVTQKNNGRLLLKSWQRH